MECHWHLLSTQVVPFQEATADDVDEVTRDGDGLVQEVRDSSS